MAFNLKYLKVEHIDRYGQNNGVPAVSRPAIYLKQLIMGNFEDEFNDVVRILNQTSNLRSLTIDANNNIHMIDACQWQQLITSSLPHLNIFKFKFQCSHESENKDIT